MTSRMSATSTGLVAHLREPLVVSPSLGATMPIQQRMSAVLSDFAKTLGGDFSIATVLDQLVIRVVEVLPVDGAGVTLRSPTSEPHYVAASDATALHCERLQAAVGEGPSFESYETGEPVALFDLRTEDRYVRFAEAATAAGVGAVVSFPLCQGSVRLGALDLYRFEPGSLDAAAMAAAQTLADVAAAYLFIAQGRADHDETAQRALQSSLHDDESEAALRASEQRKSAILASALDAVVTIDAQGRVVEFNSAAVRTFGYTEAQARGRALDDLVVPPESVYHWGVGLGQYLANGAGPVAGRRSELVGTRADGSSFPAEVSIIAVDGPGPRFFTAFVRDLTDREAASSARRDLEFRVQQTERLESLGQLAGGVAHDFNNLLTVILNYATFIAESEANDAETREQAAEIVSSAERAARLTHQMLLFARREPVRRSPIDLAALIVDTSDLLRRAVGEQVQVVVRSEDGLPLVTGDRGQTEQLLMNLAVNARDAMPAGGTFTIDTSTDQREGASFVVLSVADTGEGMTPETATRAFDPFFTTKSAGEGSGLGLATVYGIVTDAGGTIDLASRLGHGTTFTVRLPATDQAAVALDVAIAEPPAGGEGQVVLVVEDQESVRKIVVAMLSRNGYEVIQARDAAEALTMAAERRFDLLLTDIVMPGQSGTELADALTEQRSDHRVLFMSGYSGGLFGTQRELDASETIIHKPFHEADLLVAVRTALRAPPHRSAPSSIAIS